MANEKTLLLAPSTVLTMPESDPERVWVGLSSKELLAYTQDPFWVRLRTVCLVTYWLTLCSLLVAVVGLTTTGLTCNPLPDWWQQGAAMYRVLTPSFYDTDDSGLGDVAGIQSKLDYITALGVKAVWLSPVYKSPMVDFGYDIQDFKNIDEKFGTLEDFKCLVKDMKQRGLKLVMDFVPNHSSDQHEWFQKSISKEDPYTEYYVWAPAKAIVNGHPIPPNNWVSVFGGSAWEWNEKRGSFYLHQFTKEQPDLNFRNSAVLDEMLKIIEFWLELGVDGFRVDSIAHLFEDASLQDEPQSSDHNPSTDYAKLEHIYTYNLPEVKDVVAQFRQLLDNYSNNTDQIKRLMMAEVYDSVENTMKYYGDEINPLADFPFNFLLITQVTKQSTAQDVKDTVDMWLNHVPPTKWSNWVLGNHDKSRAATRFGVELIDGLNMLLLLLPGTAITYSGEEIGMEDTPISWAENVDPVGLKAGPEHYQCVTRDPQRTPMQWNANKNAGFSEANFTWLPINSNYKTVNVEAQLNGPSHLNVYKALVKARRSPAIMHGSLDMRVLNNNTIIAFTRVHTGSPGYATVVNWSNASQLVNLEVFENMPDNAEVYVRSIHSTAEDSKVISTKSLPVGPKEGIVVIFATDK